MPTAGWSWRRPDRLPARLPRDRRRHRARRPRKRCRLARRRRGRARFRHLLEASRVDIAWLRGIEGPALCRTLALCYWAGKPFEVDPFNVQQAILTGRLDPQLLRGRLASHEFAAVQWPPEFPLATPLADALDRHYEKTRTSVNGDFFVPHTEH